MRYAAHARRRGKLTWGHRMRYLQLVTQRAAVRRGGQSRQIGFVGFKTEEQAADAIKFYHNSFIDTCRLSVEVSATPRSCHLLHAYSWLEFHLLLIKDACNLGVQS
jgi:hypothetical protein